MAKLKSGEAARMAQDNYNKMKENVRFDGQGIPNFQKRAKGSVKMDNSRVSNYKQYDKNFDQIKWRSKK